MASYGYGEKISKDFRDNKELVGQVKDLYNNNLVQMRGLYDNMILNMSYIAGDQFKYLDPETKAMKDFARINGYEEREVYNLMRNMKTTFKSRITQKKPFPFATPVTNKEMDKRIASITNAVIDDEWEKQEIADKIDLIGEYIATFSCAIMKVTWDNELGDKIFPDVDNVLAQLEGSNYLNPETKQTIMQSLHRKKDIYEGDVRTEILTPFEFQVDNISRRNMKEVQYCIHSRVYHRDALKLLYNLNDEDIPEEEINAITLQQGSFSHGVGYVYSNSGYSPKKLKDHAMQHEYYERPSREYPEGRIIVTVGNAVVYYREKLPYKVGKDGKRDLPFIRVVASEEIGNFYGATPISDLRPLQRKYNSVQNRRLEALSRISIGEWLVQKGSLTRGTKIDGSPGNIIGYNPGRAKPEKHQDRTNLAEFRTETETLYSQFGRTAGFTSFDPTQINSAMRSATQMSMLMEQEDLRMLTPILQISRAIKLWAKFNIRLLQQFTVGKRFVKYQAEYDGELEWDKNLINDNIHIKNKNALVKSPAQQQQMLMDLMGMGLFDKENRYGFENTMVALESFGMGTFKADIHIPHRKDIEKAKRENKRVGRGIPIDVDKLVDNHSIHIKQHSDYLKSEEYENYMQGLNPELAIQVDKILHEHLEKHQRYLQINAMNMMKRQQAMQQR